MPQWIRDRILYKMRHEIHSRLETKGAHENGLESNLKDLENFLNISSK